MLINEKFYSKLKVKNSELLYERLLKEVTGGASWWDEVVAAIKNLDMSNLRTSDVFEDIIQDTITSIKKSGKSLPADLDGIVRRIYIEAQNTLTAKNVDQMDPAEAVKVYNQTKSDIAKKLNKDLSLGQKSPTVKDFSQGTQVGGAQTGGAQTGGTTTVRPVDPPLMPVPASTSLEVVQDFYRDFSVRIDQLKKNSVNFDDYVKGFYNLLMEYKKANLPRGFSVHDLAYIVKSDSDLMKNANTWYSRLFDSFVQGRISGFEAAAKSPPNWFERIFNKTLVGTGAIVTIGGPVAYLADMLGYTGSRYFPPDGMAKKLIGECNRDIQNAQKWDWITRYKCEMASKTFTESLRSRPADEQQFVDTGYVILRKLDELVNQNLVPEAPKEKPAPKDGDYTPSPAPQKAEEVNGPELKVKIVSKEGKTLTFTVIKRNGKYYLPAETVGEKQFEEEELNPSIPKDKKIIDAYEKERKKS